MLQLELKKISCNFYFIEYNRTKQARVQSINESKLTTDYIIYDR